MLVQLLLVDFLDYIIMVFEVLFVNRTVNYYANIRSCYHETTKSCEPAQLIYHACEHTIIRLTNIRETTFSDTIFKLVPCGE